MKSKIFIILALVVGSILIGIGTNHLLNKQVPNTESPVAYGTDDNNRAQPLEVSNANIFVELARRVVPSVVNISTMSKAQSFGRGGQGDMFRKFFEYFFRGGPQGPGGPDLEEDGSPNQPAPRSRPHALGSGFIVESGSGKGLIMTNNHVVDGADEIKISFTENPEETPTDGEVVGRDVELDIALIEVKTKRKMVPLALGNSETLQVGEYVMAVGNPIGHGHSVSHGIISAKGRNAPNFPLARYIQTDAPINPGNSGGPLVNLKGEVIGINNAIDARAQGIGFAIPINAVKQILPQLKSKGSVARGYIGVLVNGLTPDVAEQIGVDKNLKAPFVAHVYPGEPADKAGLEPYDVILEVNGQRIRTSQDLIRTVTSVEVGKTVPLKIIRSGKEKKLKIKVAERPTSNQLAKGVPLPKKRAQKKWPVDTGMTLETIDSDVARRLGLPKDTKGVVVTSLEYEGPAARSGLYRGDVILEVNKKKIRSVGAFYKIVKEKKSYLLRIRRPAPQGQAVFSVVILDLKS